MFNGRPFDFVLQVLLKCNNPCRKKEIHISGMGFFNFYTFLRDNHLDNVLLEKITELDIRGKSKNKKINK